MAIRFASVPELVKRTRASPNREHIRPARFDSWGWMPPTAARFEVASTTASRTRRSLCPNRPAGWAPNKSRYSWPSASTSTAPRPATNVSGKGGCDRIVRVCPPGSTLQASSNERLLSGLRSENARRALATISLATRSVSGPVIISRYCHAGGGYILCHGHPTTARRLAVPRLVHRHRNVADDARTVAHVRSRAHRFYQGRDRDSVRPLVDRSPGRIVAQRAPVRPRLGASRPRRGAGRPGALGTPRATHVDGRHALHTVHDARGVHRLRRRRREHVGG